MSAKECAVFKKTIVFRIFSFIMTLIASRIWFGNWHMTPFAIFLIPYCSVIYYIFELFWKRMESLASEVKD